MLAERADAAEKVVRELEDKEAATEAAASVAAEDADALSKEKVRFRPIPVGRHERDRRGYFG